MASLECTISSTLECPVCLKLLTDPKQLSCSHTFCKSCLGKILACSWQLEAANSLTCPICRSLTEVKDGDVTNLTTSVPFKSLVDDLRKTQQLCELCQTNSKAVHFCQNCGRNMCDECLAIHNQWPPHLQHKVVLVEDIRERKVILKKKIYCQENVHDESDGQQNLCTDVCITCKKFICMRCRVVFHEKKGHTVEDAGEYNRYIEEQIKILQAVGAAKAASITDHMEFTEEQMKRVTDHISGIYNGICSVYQELIEKLNESKAALTAMVDVQKGSLCQRLQRMKDEQERMVASLQSASALLSDSLKVPLGGDVVAIRDSLSRQLQSMIEQDDPDDELAADVTDRAKELFFKPDKPDSLSIGNFYVRYDMVRSVKLSGKMSSLASAPDGRMAVGYSGGGIEFISEHGQVQQKVLTEVEIRGVRFLSDDSYVVLDVSNNVTLYSPTCEKSDARFATLGPDAGGVASLAVGNFDLIYVGYCKRNMIHEFPPGGGNAIREIPCSGFEPAQMTFQDKLLIISHDISTKVIDKDGVVKHRVKKANLYSYATVGQNNSILIAWVMHDQGLVTFEKFSSKLKPVRTLISDHKIEKSRVNWYHLQVFKSGGIAFCTPNRLYIWASPQ